MQSQTPARAEVSIPEPMVPAPPSPPPGEWSSGLPSREGVAAGTAVDAPQTPPAPADDRRPCPSCSAGNLPAALSCWQCQTPFRQAPGQFGSPGAFGGPTQSWSGHADPAYRPIPDTVALPKQQPTAKVVGAAIFVVAVLGGFFGYRLLTSPGVTLPETLAGVDRLEIPAIESEIDRFKDEVSRMGFDGDAAMYGTAGIPSFMVMLIDDSPGDAEIEDSLLRQFAEGFSSGGSLQIDLGSIDVTQEGEATLRCTAITGGPEVSMCMWVDPDTVGFVFTFLQAVDPTRELTRQIRTTLQA